MNGRESVETVRDPTPCQALCGFVDCISFDSYNTPGGRRFLKSPFEMRIWRHREVKKLAQGHTAVSCSGRIQTRETGPARGSRLLKLSECISEGSTSICRSREGRENRGRRPEGPARPPQVPAECSSSFQTPAEARAGIIVYIVNTS